MREWLQRDAHPSSSAAVSFESYDRDGPCSTSEMTTEVCEDPHVALFLFLRAFGGRLLFILILTPFELL